MKNYYAILEVPVGCPVTEIREAYRRLVQENLWNKETFAELKEAYEVLTTPARRNEYDRSTFGETFPSGDTTMMPLTSDSSLRENARHCPMGAAAQCPVINARVPLQETYCPECGFLLAAMSAQEFEPVAQPDPQKQIRLEDTAGRLYVLRPGLNSVGREGTDVLLPEKTVSRRHAQIEVAAGTVAVEDLGSTNGTRINGQMLGPGTAQTVLDGESVQFGSIELRLRLPENAAQEETGNDTEPASTRPPEPAKAKLIGIRGGVLREVPLVPGVTTFGRRAENSVVIRDDPYVSGSHAQIIAEGDVFRLTDLGSTNGTMVNKQPLPANQPHEIATTDEIVIGSTAYRFERLETALETPHDGTDAALSAEMASGEAETDADGHTVITRIEADKTEE